MTKDERIRFIFKKNRRFTRAGAAKALGKSVRWVEDNRFSRENGGWLSWQEMVLLAYALWTRLQIARALADDFAKVYPARARFVEVSVQIPEYLAIALRREARRRKIDVSEIVADDITVYFDEAEELEKEAQGYLRAWLFPYPPSDGDEYRSALARRRAVRAKA
jgi:hypothetical protein